MADSLWIKPDVVTDGANDFLAVSERLRTAIGNFVTTLAGCEGTIGCDSAGHGFAHGHNPIREQIEAAAKHTVRLMTGVEHGGVAMARTHRGTDVANAESMKLP